MSESTIFDVTVARDIRRKEISLAINNAFDHRSKEVSNVITEQAGENAIGESYTQSSIERARKARSTTLSSRAIGQSGSDSVIKLPDFPNCENEVLVEDSHDYPELLKQALKKIETYARVKIDPDEEKRVLEKHLNHEYKHHVHGLGEQGLKMKYGVRFNEDPEKAIISFQPFVELKGEVRKEVLHRIFSGPEDLSISDEEFLK